MPLSEEMKVLLGEHYDRERIEGRLKAITGQKWVRFSDRGVCLAVMPAGIEGDICIRPRVRERRPASEHEANMLFIACAPTDMQACLDEIDRLTKLLEG